MATMYMMVGIAGSGKSYVAAQIGAPVVSSDAIREEMYGDESIQGDANRVFNEVHRRIKEYLANGEDVIYDATNLSAKRRKGFLSQLPKDVRKVAVVVATDIDLILKQNAERERHVPEDVIMRMYRSFQFPEVSEGFDRVDVVVHPDNKSSVESELKKCESFDQKNPHHSATLGVHMEEAGRYAYERRGEMPDRVSERMLVDAARLHDIGKPDTQTFVKPNGVVDTSAHYYNHENVGAYKLACMRDHMGYTEAQWAAIIRLVQHHMDGYSFKGDKEYAKFGAVYGADMQKAIRIIHDADLNAH